MRFFELDEEASYCQLSAVDHCVLQFEVEVAGRLVEVFAGDVDGLVLVRFERGGMNLTIL